LEAIVLDIGVQLWMKLKDLVLKDQKNKKQKTEHLLVMFYKYSQRKNQKYLKHENN
jgi:hypothetical protein